MNNIEDRLRDAYRGAADTVRPDAIRGLYERSAVIARPAPWRAGGSLQRWLVPLTAAAAVLIIGVAAAVVVPAALRGLRAQANAGQGSHQGAGHPAGDPATHFLVAVAARTGSYLAVHSAANGSTVTSITPPSGESFGQVATGNGKSYVAVLQKDGSCGSWLYRFTISRSGRLGALTRFAPGFLDDRIGQLALSQDGSTLAFAGQKCGKARSPVLQDLGVLKLATRQLKEWQIPGRATINPLSLSADGRLLAYSIGRNGQFPRGLYVLAANATQGSAPQRSRLLASSARFGAATVINSELITPDGGTVYFTTFANGKSPGSWTLRAVSVATSRSHLILRRPGFAEQLVGDTSVRELFAFVQAPVLGVAPAPSPSASAPLATPTPYPSSSPVPTGTPVPSGSPAPSPVPSSPPAPSPVPSGSPAPSPVPSASPRAAARLAIALTALRLRAAGERPQVPAVIKIAVPGGRSRSLDPVPWDLAGNRYVW